jgi:hypothetical protein
MAISPSVLWIFYKESVRKTITDVLADEVKTGGPGNELQK